MDPITKDFLYAKTQFTHSLYDITPLDHNRCLSTVPLAEAQNNSLMWFSELEEKEQIQVFIILLKLSGSTITYQFYLEAVKYQCKEPSIDGLRQQLLTYPFVQALTATESFQKMLSPTKNENEEDIISSSKNAIGRTPSPKSLEEIPSIQTIKGNQRVTPALEAKTREWEKLFSKLLYESGLFKDKNEPPPAIDMMQLLPVTASGIIYTHLDNKAKKNLKLINKYWNKSVISLNKDISTRTWLNKQIKTLKLKLFHMKTKGWKFNPFYVMKKPTVTYSFSDDEIRKKSKSKVRLSKKLKRVSSQPMIKTEPTVVKTEPKYNVEMVPTTDRIYQNMYPRDPYKGKFTISNICSRFDHTRCIAANFQWIAMSDECDITLHKVLTGVPTPYQLKGHSGYVTALCFHQRKSLLYSGSYDTSIKCWDVYSRKVIMSYANHSSLITSLSLNENYLISGSLDNMIRVFKIDTGLMMWIYNMTSIPIAIAIGFKLDIYVGLDNGNLFKTDVGHPKEPKEEHIVLSHMGGITCIFFDHPFIMTGGHDGFVRVWHCEYLNATALVNLDHKRNVSSVCLSFMKVLTTADDGILRIWDLYNGTLKREILVNHARRPVLSMLCLEVYDHTKVIINNEDGLKVIEFPYDWIKFKKKCPLKNNKEPKVYRGLTRIISTKPDEVLSNFQYTLLPKETYGDRCREKLFLRHASLPTIIEPKKGDLLTLKNISVFNEASINNFFMFLFPRILPSIRSLRNRHKTPKKEDENYGTNIPIPFWKYLPRSTKDILPANNPSKVSL